jgi:hypothetical protein
VQEVLARALDRADVNDVSVSLASQPVSLASQSVSLASHPPMPLSAEHGAAGAERGGARAGPGVALPASQSHSAHVGSGGVRGGGVRKSSEVISIAHEDDLQVSVNDDHGRGASAAALTDSSGFADSNFAVLGRLLPGEEKMGTYPRKPPSPHPFSHADGGE